MVRVLEAPFRKQSAVARNWELVILARRFVLLAAYTFIEDPFWQEVALTISCIAILAMHLGVAPFRRPWEQQLESASLSVLVGLAVLSFSKYSKQVQGYPIPHGVFMLQVAALVAPLCVGVVLLGMRLVLGRERAVQVLGAGIDAVCKPAARLAMRMGGGDGRNGGASAGAVEHEHEMARLTARLGRLGQRLAAKDKELATKDEELAANSKELAAKDEELAAFRAAQGEGRTRIGEHHQQRGGGDE